MQKQLFFIACVISAQATHAAHVATKAAGALIGVYAGLIAAVPVCKTAIMVADVCHNRKDAADLREFATATASTAANLFEEKSSDGVDAMRRAAHYHASSEMLFGIGAFRSSPYSYPSGSSDYGYSHWSTDRELRESVDVARLHRDFYAQQAVNFRTSGNVFGAEQCEMLAEQAQALYSARRARLDQRYADNNAESAAAIEKATFDIEHALHLNA